MRTFTGIQAMRGIAALSVVCGHAVTMRWDMGLTPQQGASALGLLASGVDIFFVISGFIIANTASEMGKARGRMGAIRFAFKRAGRIYPVYWAVLTAAFISSYWIAVFPAEANYSTAVGLEQILSLTTMNYYVPPAWSLCFELYFYAAVAVIILIAPRHVMQALVAALCALVATLILTDIRFSSVYCSPLTLEFGFGVGIACLIKLGFHPSRPRVCIATAACFFAAGAYLATDPRFNGYQRLATYGVGAALIIYSVIASELNGATFPRWLQYLGTISYPLYASHHLLLTWLAKYDAPWLPGPVQILIWIALAVGLAAVLYGLFERPLLVRLRIAMPKHATAT